MTEWSAALSAIVHGSPPGLLLVLAAIPVALLPHRISQAAMLTLPVVGLYQLFQMPAEFSQTITLFEYSLEITRIGSPPNTKRAVMIG